MVDDEIKLRKILARELEDEGYEVFQAGSGSEAIQVLERNNIKVVILDLMLPDMTGLDLLSNIPKLKGDIPTIILTAYGNVESAVTSMKLGAFDYICKPVRFEELKIFLDKAFKWLDMKEENERLRILVESFKDEIIIGKSPVMDRVYFMVGRVSDSDVTVLLEGESGTGKSFIAKLIHEKSARKDKPFISVNCAAIPEKLLESELFGYVKGAFTGAVENREGKFAAADGGTIFLDEIGEIPLSLQGKLLQVTQEKSFMKLGSNKENRVDVRIITATNKDLTKLVEEGQFREDLYYRLNIVSIRVPALRERKEDIPLMAMHFLTLQEKKIGKPFELDSNIMDFLISYYWAGNIRELKNAIERASVLSKNNKITIDDFLLKSDEYKNVEDVTKCNKPLQMVVEEYEKQLIITALNKTNGNSAKAAKILKVSRQNLLYKMQKHNLKD